MLRDTTYSYYIDPKSYANYFNKRFSAEAKLRLFQQLHQDTETDFYRASGSCLCELCGLEYRKHPYDEELAVNRLCNGEFVHL